ncbi:MAG: M23 family metallopeptidase [Pseudobacteriovorax sp.]|nr:M23 family metallopeptidase [Pseudobacteriovorax sp.]
MIRSIHRVFSIVLGHCKFSAVLVCSLAIVSCGIEETVTLEKRSHTVDSKDLDILSLSTRSAGLICPSNFQYNTSTRLCETSTEALGPFPVKMINQCLSYGGGEACRGAIWSRSFARSLRGSGVCPNGSTRDASSGLCIDRNNESAFGPFTEAHIKNCQASGGGRACEQLRWSLSFALATLPESETVEPDFVFPFAGPATADYTVPPRSFGSCRSNCSRLHAGADLYGPIGRPVYAVADGVITDFHYFYRGTYALVIDHGVFVVRYGEVSFNLPRGISVGQRVRRGQRIGSVGDLQGLNINMLHFERYTGEARGPLTTSTGPYKRRWDLVDPTEDLIAWPYPR